MRVGRDQCDGRPDGEQGAQGPGDGWCAGGEPQAQRRTTHTEHHRVHDRAVGGRNGHEQPDREPQRVQDGEVDPGRVHHEACGHHTGRHAQAEPLEPRRPDQQGPRDQVGQPPDDAHGDPDHGQAGRAGEGDDAHLEAVVADQPVRLRVLAGEQGHREPGDHADAEDARRDRDHQRREDVAHAHGTPPFPSRPALLCIVPLRRAGRKTGPDGSRGGLSDLPRRDTVSP